MKIANALTARIELREYTGTVGSANLQVEVEDAEIRKVLPGFNGLERVTVDLPQRDGGTRTVDLKFQGSVDPAAQQKVTYLPNDGTQGPHRGGARVEQQPSGRVVDVHTATVSQDDFDLNALRHQKQVEFKVWTNDSSEPVTVTADPQVLWR